MATALMEESTIAIVEQIQKCPSVALSYFMHTQVEEPVEVGSETIVKIRIN